MASQPKLPDRGAERVDSAKAKIIAATHVVAGPSLIAAAIVPCNTVYPDRAVRQWRAQKTMDFDDLPAHLVPLIWSVSPRR